MITRLELAMTCGLIVVPAFGLCAQESRAETEPPRLVDVAQPTTRPAGAPKYSDVCFSSRWIRPVNEKDPHDSLAMIEAFRATRLDWAYITDAKFIQEIKRRGLTFCPATNSSAFVDDLRPLQKRGRILDLDGNIVTAPWMRMWKNSSWGCVNSPDYRESYLARLKQYADLGADSIQTDDPGNNWTATRWGACFCDHCTAGFRQFIRDALNADQRAALGITDIDSFDYAEELRKAGAPVDDAFGSWDGGKLKEHFVEFQKQSVETFYRDMWSALEKHAGRRIPMSSNNGSGRWSFPYHLFDYGMAELSHRDAHPALIREKLMAAAQLGKAQVFTFVSKDVEETRRVIAACYANGGHLIVPWDVYLKSTPEGSERYFGKPEEYADLYGFARENARYLDGYEDAAAVGPEIRDDRYARPPLSISGSDHVAAFVRVRPGEPDAPVVIHLVSTTGPAESFTLTWRKSALFGDLDIRAELRRPGKPTRHIPIRTGDTTQSANIESSTLWAILIIRPH